MYKKRVIASPSLKVIWQVAWKKYEFQREKDKHTHTAFNNDLAKKLFKLINSKELQDSEKVSTIWINLNSIVKKMNSTKSSMIDMKSKDAIKIDVFKLKNFEIYPEENVLLEDDLHRCQPGEQHGDKKGGLLTLSGVKTHID